MQTLPPPLVLLSLFVALGSSMLASGCSETERPRPSPMPDAGPASLGEQLDRRVRETLAERRVSGVVVSVTRGGEPLLERGYGFAELAPPRPLDAAAVLPVGSVTKQFTAALILKLVEAGRLELDDALAEHLPGYLPDGERVSIRQLLNHTSGLADYDVTIVDWLEGQASSTVPLTHEQIVAWFASKPLEFEPGTRFAYTNSGYYALGDLIERLTGMPYMEALAQHLLAPAGLVGIEPCAAVETRADAVRGYRVTAPGVLSPVPFTPAVYTYAAGGLCASVSALRAWVAALSGGRVLSTASFRTMAEESVLRDGSSVPYGFGLALSRLGEHRVISHGGGLPGFVSDLAYYPDDDLSIVVLANAESDLAAKLSLRLARVVLGVPEPVILDLPVSREQAEGLVGRYALPELELELFYEHGGLHARDSATKVALRLRSQGDGRFIALEVEATFTFELVEGRATALWLEQQGGRSRAVRLGS